MHEVDINQAHIKRARELNACSNVEYMECTETSIPLASNSVDVVISIDVFEHVLFPREVIREIYRVVEPQGTVFIATWGWYHPFAPHLSSVMPVPWCHVVFSEKTIMRTCRRIYKSEWYKPVKDDFDDEGNLKADKYLQDHIPVSYVNKLFLRDFEKIFEESGFAVQICPRGFSHKLAKWTGVFLHVPYVKELVTSYVCVALQKPGEPGRVRSRPL